MCPPGGARGVVFLAGLWVAVAICASRAYGRSRRVSVGAPVRCVRCVPVAGRRVPVAGRRVPVICPDDAAHW
jgi:hypothetical protein